MLQDLIKNYEKLEKISKAHSGEIDSTDTEVEELFNSERSKRNEESKSTTAGATHKAYATAMFFEERDLNPDSKSENMDTKSSSDSVEMRIGEPRPNGDIKQQEKEKEDTKRTVKKQADTKNNASEIDNKADESFVPAIKALKNLIKNFSSRSASAETTEKDDEKKSSTTTTAGTTTKKSLLLESPLHSKGQLPKMDKLIEPRLQHNEMPAIIRKTRKNNDDDILAIGTPGKKPPIATETSNETKNNDDDIIIIGTPEKKHLKKKKETKNKNDDVIVRGPPEKKHLKEKKRTSNATKNIELKSKKVIFIGEFAIFYNNNALSCDYTNA